MKIKRKLSDQELYDRYRKKYLKMEEKVIGYGGTMHKEMLTKEQYLTRRTGMYNLRKRQIEKGTRTSMGNIDEDLLKQQAYDPRISYNKAKMILEWWFSKNGIDRQPTMIEIQAFRVKGAVQEMKAFYKSTVERLKKDNPELTKEEINRLASQEVGQEFFESPMIA